MCPFGHAQPPRGSIRLGGNVGQADGTELFASTRSYHLLHSADSGITWNPIGPQTRSLVSDFVRIGEVVFVNDGNGPSRLGDDGKWITKWPFASGYGTRLFEIGDTLYASAQDGLHRSVDTGNTWQLLTPFFESNRDMRALIRRGDEWFAGSSTGVYHTRDGGKTWAGLNAGLQGHIVWGFVEALTKDRWRSLDGGGTWLPFGKGLPETSGLRYLDKVYTLGQVVFATLIGWGVYRSVDKGLTWSRAWPDSAKLSPFRLAVLGNQLLAAGY